MGVTAQTGVQNRFWRDDLTREESVVEALGRAEVRQAADTLFEELDRTESSNSTRGYINAILKALRGFPLKFVEDGFERLLSDTKWFYRMKRKFRERWRNNDRQVRTVREGVQDHS